MYGGLRFQKTKKKVCDIVHGSGWWDIYILGKKIKTYYLRIYCFISPVDDNLFQYILLLLLLVIYIYIKKISGPCHNAIFISSFLKKYKQSQLYFNNSQTEAFRN